MTCINKTFFDKGDPSVQDLFTQFSDAPSNRLPGMTYDASPNAFYDLDLIEDDVNLVALFERDCLATNKVIFAKALRNVIAF